MAPPHGLGQDQTRRTVIARAAMAGGGGCGWSLSLHGALRASVSRCRAERRKGLACSHTSVSFQPLSTRFFVRSPEIFGDHAS